MSRPNKKLVEQIWIPALRSGKYVQGTDKLWRLPSKRNETDEFCCLGVYAHAIDTRARPSKSMAGSCMEFITDNDEVLRYDLKGSLGDELGLDVGMSLEWPKDFEKYLYQSVTDADMYKFILGNKLAVPVFKGEQGVLRTDLPILNDYYKFSFNEIADLLEKWAEGWE